MMKQLKLPYTAPQTELAFFEPSQLIAQSNPDSLTLPGTIVDPFITP